MTESHSKDFFPCRFPDFPLPRSAEITALPPARRTVVIKALPHPASDTQRSFCTFHFPLSYFCQRDVILKPGKRDVLWSRSRPWEGQR